MDPRYFFFGALLIWVAIIIASSILPITVRRGREDGSLSFDLAIAINMFADNMFTAPSFFVYYPDQKFTAFPSCQTEPVNPIMFHQAENPMAVLNPEFDGLLPVLQNDLLDISDSINDGSNNWCGADQSLNATGCTIASEWVTVCFLAQSDNQTLLDDYLHLGCDTLSATLRFLAFACVDDNGRVEGGILFKKGKKDQIKGYIGVVATQNDNSGL